MDRDSAHFSSPRRDQRRLTSAATAFLGLFALGLSCAATVQAAERARVDVSRYSGECGVEIKVDQERLHIHWPMEGGDTGLAILNLRSDRALIQALGCVGPGGAGSEGLLQQVDPVAFVTIGTRVAPTGRPPSMSVWNTFFDKPSNRPYQTHGAKLDLKRVQVSSSGCRATVAVSELELGPFRGEWQFVFYATSRLVQVEAVVSTTQDKVAFLYDAGLAGEAPGCKTVSWVDLQGRLQREAIETFREDRPLAVRHRTVLVEGEQGAVACFPAPHQYQFPRDWTDNLKFVWAGPGHQGTRTPFGFGIRQVADGGRAFEPWFNAPPGTKQRLGLFLLVCRERAEQALRETLRYTHADRFPKLPGHITFTSHYHMAVAVEAMKRQFQGTPEFVSVFKEMGVDAVHIADFHGDGHPKDPGPLRLPEMEAMFKECERLSDGSFLLIPGEEINEFLGLSEPGKHPGHWMSLFPKPVYWIQRRTNDQALVEAHPRYGSLYRVGSRADMIELLRRERGLAWAAHPRIKASSWTPDIFRKEDFYLADNWVGGAWKAMPADLSRERLGERGLDLLSDMANWGQRKYAPGEVDVFKIDRTHELYGHMNINYVRLNRLPRYEEGWQPLLDALQAGQFFVTTGEILLHEFSVGGKGSGEALRLRPGEPCEVRMTFDWTFPARFAEVISGDGTKVFRERVELMDTTSFGRRTLSLRPALEGRSWVRVEVWDVAANGAFSQPVWIER